MPFVPLQGRRIFPLPALQQCNDQQTTTTTPTRPPPAPQHHPHDALPPSLPTPTTNTARPKTQTMMSSESAAPLPGATGGAGSASNLTKKPSGSTAKMVRDL